MLRSFARLPLRRCIQTSTRQAHVEARKKRLEKATSALGVTTIASGIAVYAAYAAWHDKGIAADSPDHPLSAQSASSRPAVSSAVSDHTHLSASLDSSTSSASFSSTSTTPPPPSHVSPTIDPDADPSSDGESAEGGESGGGSSQGGAFNPETGEINWDCPCLGGMAHGPCGEQFRAAFSCFVFSEDEPKGINCVDKFRLMQDCFREHPDVYGEEIMNDDDDEQAPALDGDAPAPVSASEPSSEFAPESSPSEKLGGSEPEHASPDAAPLSSTA